MELSIYLGRMPIMTADGELFAYELLHRSTEENYTVVNDDLHATARVLVNALNYIGLQTLTQSKPAFIKVDDKAIFDDLILCISNKHFVLEILESSFVSSSLVKRVKELHEKGYTFGLNHYEINADFILHFKELLPYLSYIKIDIKKNNRDKIITALKNLDTSNICLIAEKVETMDDFEWSREAGFDYFEGHYFSKPRIYSHESIDPDNQTLLELIYLLKSEASFEEIINIFNTSPYLSINLLKFIHLHHGNGEEKIASIEQSLILLGREKLTYWIELMIYAQKDNADTEDNITSPLGQIARSRATLMEELAHLISNTTKSVSSSSAYLVGILSLAEAIFQNSFEQLFEQMNLDRSISSALINKEGNLGELLKLCIAVENSNFIEINKCLSKFDLSQNQLNKAMMQSYQRTSKE